MSNALGLIICNFGKDVFVVGSFKKSHMEPTESNGSIRDHHLHLPVARWI